MQRDSRPPVRDQQPPAMTVAPPPEPRPRPRPPPHPIQAGLSRWMATIRPPEADDDDDDAAAATWAQTLRDHAPRRFTIYEPMALLPAGSFATGPWTAELARHPPAVVHALWGFLLAALSERMPGGRPRRGPRSRCLTHLAVNEGIPPRNHQPPTDADTTTGTGTASSDNVLRSPSGLRILRGDFGPPAPGRGGPPSEDDFARAFWVSTRQNGILQVWAPRWTMFSRGNVKEKARLLRFPTASPLRPRPDRRLDDAVDAESAADTDDIWAVDLYAGIGYFAFSYAKRGLRTLCWELNPWSAEGLRRAARANGWTVDVLQGLPPGDHAAAAAEIARARARVVVLQEDNRLARARADALRRLPGPWLRDVRHVNCGLLPSSRLSWPCALSLAGGSSTATWLHLHENVAEADIQARTAEVEALLRGGLDEESAVGGGIKSSIRVEGVEKVKTYAPGVWHCVFDVLVGEN